MLLRTGVLFCADAIKMATFCDAIIDDMRWKQIFAKGVFKKDFHVL
jgi:hypothetical protein